MVFAAGGTATAGLAGMDALGCTIVGTITAVGGGTTRDLLIGNVPVFWVVEYEYILMCLAACTATLICWELDEDLFNKYIDGREMFWLDSIGIGAFCAIGAQNGIRRGLHPVICILCGVVTSTFGGVTRDVLTKRPVRIMHANAEIYATCAGAGASMYMAVRALGMHPAVRIASAMVTAVSMRYWAVDQDIKLPLAPPCRVAASEQKQELETKSVSAE